MRKRSGWSVIVFLAISILLSVFCIPIMYVLDQQYSLLQKIPHNFSGEIWFPLISDFILTIPANAVCVFALWQTWYYHKLDEECLHPKICMKSATLEMLLVDWGEFEKSVKCSPNFKQKWWDKLQDYRKKHKLESDGDSFSVLGFLCLHAKLFLKDGESVRRIEMEDITIRIGDQEYVMKFREKFREFVATYKNGQEMYEIEWELDFDDINTVLSEEKNSQKAFWDNIYEVLFDDNCSVTKRNMIWTVNMKINYGVNETKRKRAALSVKWEMLWDWQKRKKPNEYVRRCKAKGGVLKAT